MAAITVDRVIVDAAKVDWRDSAMGLNSRIRDQPLPGVSSRGQAGLGARDPLLLYGGQGLHELFAKWGLGGWPEGESKRIGETRCVMNADRIETPLLVNSADSEFLATLALCSALEELRKPVELYIYPNELHIKNQPRHRYEIYERNLDWFRFWLQAEQDPNPDKREQYSRWRRFLGDQRRNAVR
jgi:hypothetical protein